MTFTSFMDVALEEAHAAGQRGEIPVGACIVRNGEIISRAGNQMRADMDPTAHAEMLVIRAACKKLANERLSGCDLYVTLEPCVQCAGAISAARIDRLYYAASDPKTGGVEQGATVFAHPQAHHKPEVYGGIAEGEAAAMLKDFFASRRSGR